MMRNSVGGKFLEKFLSSGISSHIYILVLSEPFAVPCGVLYKLMTEYHLPTPTSYFLVSPLLKDLISAEWYSLIKFNLML